jgi:hypothetical protein
MLLQRTPAEIDASDPGNRRPVYLISAPSPALLVTVEPCLGADWFCRGVPTPLTSPLVAPIVDSVHEYGTTERELSGSRAYGEGGRGLTSQ